MTANGTAASPLGHYGEAVAAFGSLAVLVAWLLAQLGIFGLAATPALDTGATLVLGVILGQRATTNGAAKIANAAMLRLDAIGAPPAAASNGKPRA